MSRDNFLDKNALSLSALRDLCVAYDKENNTHRPPGWDVFRYIVRHVLKNVAGVADILEMTDIKQWVSDVDFAIIPPVFNHGTVQVVVTSVHDDVIDVESEACEEAALCSSGQLQMLKEGANPSLEESWIPVAAISDLTVAVDPAGDQSVTGSVGIPSDAVVSEWRMEDPLSDA